MTTGANGAPQAQQARASHGDKRSKKALRALVIPFPVEKAAGDPEPGKSKLLPEDPWEHLVGEGQIIDPPFDLLSLAMLEERNTELTPIFDALETNIDGFGYQLQSRKETTDPAVRAERTRLTNFFNYASLEDSFTTLRAKRRRDLESTGNAYWEVVRNAAGELQGFNHVPSYQVRCTPLDKDPIKVSVPTLQLQVDGGYKVVEIDAWERYRRFAQSVLTPSRGVYATESGTKRWFKAFGDPRVLDCTTGEFVAGKDLTNWKGTEKEMPQALRANEMIQFKLYCPRSPYGMPRYIGNLLSIEGARSAEEINFITFDNNNIPSMAILVSNGGITEGTVERIESFVESQIQGSGNRSKFLIIEAEPTEMDSGEDAGQAKIDIKPLTNEQIKDVMFEKYTQHAEERLRRVWRLPPIILGRSEDYTRATAEASRKLADEQVFAPEREEFDTFINRRIFPVMGVQFHAFKSNSPNTTDNQELVKILSGGEKTGGITPRIARIVLEDILGRELPELKQTDSFDPDMPFSLSMAEAVKNKADPTEPGQQLTALKALQAIGQFDEVPDDDGGTDDRLVGKLMQIRRRLEAAWEARVSETDDHGDL